ncbi:MAG: GNAT family N-acetyltransferase [Alphaproteobacteria bacterium]|nr:GNAT family N-acetyltransferase [Alphaproteobacteria bacterium]
MPLLPPPRSCTASCTTPSSIPGARRGSATWATSWTRRSRCWPRRCRAARRRRRGAAEAQLRAREDEWAAVLATGPVGAPTGVISVTWDGREARITGLAVHRDHRRTGLGRALLLGALQEWQGVAFGTAYAVTEPGSPAEALFRSVEMRPVTSVFRVARR